LAVLTNTFELQNSAVPVAVDVDRWNTCMAASNTVVWTFGTPSKLRNFVGRNGIFAESHRSIFGRKRNLPKQFKLLHSVQKPKPNFDRPLSIC